MQMDNINDIISNLSAQDIENLRAAAESFFGSHEEKHEEKREEKKNFSSSGMPDLGSILGNAQMMAKLSSIMSAMNKPDQRAELIKALKPLLSEKRRKRADDAMQMLRLFEILPLLSELMGGNRNE